MAARSARRLAAGAVATGGVTTAIWWDALPALALAVGVLVLFLMWVLSDGERTQRAVDWTNAVKGRTDPDPLDPAKARRRDRRRDRRRGSRR